MKSKIFFFLLFRTWCEEGEVEDESRQDEPGVGCGTVVVGPDWPVCRVCLVQTSKNQKAVVSVWLQTPDNATFVCWCLTSPRRRDWWSPDQWECRRSQTPPCRFHGNRNHKLDPTCRVHRTWRSFDSFITSRISSPTSSKFSEIKKKHFLAGKLDLIFAFQSKVDSNPESPLRVLSAGRIQRVGWVEGDSWSIVSRQQEAHGQQGQTESSACIRGENRVD